ncbi:conserved hypothetical protein, partial [Trichinella spiralis]
LKHFFTIKNVMSKYISTLKQCNVNSLKGCNMVNIKLA